MKYTVEETTECFERGFGSEQLELFYELLLYDVGLLNGTLVTCSMLSTFRRRGCGLLDSSE
jgi:hypothetical protein